jgi:hypothetical protein
MKNPLAYRISLGISIVLTLLAFITLLGWLGTVINGWGKVGFISLLPWRPVVLVLLTAVNCTIRARLIAHRRPLEMDE